MSMVVKMKQKPELLLKQPQCNTLLCAKNNKHTSSRQFVDAVHLQMAVCG